jgi:hypothetical protein
MICQIIPASFLSRDPLIEITTAHNRITNIALENGLTLAGSVTLNQADQGGGNTLDIIFGIAPEELNLEDVKEMEPVETVYSVTEQNNVVSQLLPQHGWGEKYDLKDAQDIHSFARSAVIALKSNNILISAYTVNDGSGIQAIASRTKL